MPLETVRIEISKVPAFEAASTLFSVIAYPDDKVARSRFADAACNVLLRRFLAADPTIADTPQFAPIRPRHWALDPEQADLLWKRGEKILMNERLEAARMVSPRWAAFVERTTGIPHPGLNNLAPLHPDVMAAVSVSLDERRGRDTQVNKRNIGTRVLKNSKPVIHLCLGMRRVIEEVMPDRRTFNPLAFFGVPELTLMVIERASWVHQFADQAFDGISSEKMIEVITA
jgi:hypothetical protein